ISEFEDWHFSRLKFLNPWPFIDWYYWKKSISSITFGICVNNFLASKFRKNNIKYLIVPGILNKKIFLIKNDPFNNSKITLGYFGGLTNEKGASKIIDLIENTNEYNFIITGSGILSNQFKNLSIKYPNRLKFYGVVDEITLMDLYNKIDIFINFHVIMEGIFPFKIIEALAAGRFIVSSKLDTSFIDIPENILVHSDLNLTQILYTISNIKQNYNKNNTNLKVAQKKIIEEYSEIAIAKKINNILECLV
ncbi:MAG: glycosyltransferase, partial [Bacteroidia bacterium]|nr:glycosyltransferase [Bacteroidia bacterium]